MRIIRIILLVFIIPAFISCGSSGPATKSDKPDSYTDAERLLSRGVYWYQKGCYSQALSSYFRAHELYTASDQLSGVAMSLNNIANIYRINGDTKSAILIFEESYEIYTDLGNIRGSLQALSNKAAVLINTDKLNEAEKVLKKAEKTAEENKITFVPLIKNRGIHYFKQKKHDKAEAALTLALENTDPSKNTEFSSVNVAFGNLMYETGNYEKADEYYKAALTIDRKTDNQQRIADDLLSLGMTSLKLDDIQSCVKYLKRSVKIFALLGNKERVDDIMLSLTKVAKKADVDITVTKHFIDQWLSGKVLEDPCR